MPSSKLNMIRADRAYMDLPSAMRRYDPHKKVLSEGERQANALQELHEAFRQEHANTGDTLPYRIRVAWRIVRAMATARGAAPEDTLAEIMTPNNSNPDPWRIPTLLKPWSQIASRAAATRSPAAARVHHLLVRAEQMAAQHQSCYYQPQDRNQLEQAEIVANGLAYSPPPAPYRWTRGDDLGAGSHGAAQERDWGNHPLIKLWIEIVEVIARDLGIERGSHYEPDLGTIGLLPLVDPDTAFELWPDWRYLIMWEEELAGMALEAMTSGRRDPKGVFTGVRRDLLQKEHGLTARECNIVMKLAHRLAREQATHDVEDIRAVSIMRLEDALIRARNALDLRNELGIMKQLAIVQGLSRTEPANEQTLFVELARSLDKEASHSGTLPMKTVKNLTLDV